VSGAGAQVVVIAKAPVPGKVKTRLCPPLSFDAAATLARAALMDTLDALSAAGVARITLVLDGTPGRWLRPGIDVIPQRPGPFAERLSGAIEDAYSALPLPVLLVGMDTPQMESGHLERAGEALMERDTDAVLGPAEDGGFWILGTRRPVPGMFDGVPMSTATTGAEQFARLSALGLRCTLTGRLRDVDVLGDALAVAREAPHTRFAAVLRTCLRTSPSEIKEPVTVA
jgi:uncharacterized protein